MTWALLKVFHERTRMMPLCKKLTMESVFKKVAGVDHRRCFPVTFAKIFRTVLQ